MSLRIGIDIGSTTVKVVVLDEQNKLLFRSYERHYSKTRERACETLHSITGLLAGKQVKMVITGSAGLGVANASGIDFVQEVYATAAAVNTYIPKTDAVIELGGEDAKIIFFGGALEERMNGSCAGGTGAFIDQMATLMNVTVGELDALSLKHEKIYPIASRCGVFAKSDIQPILNQGGRKEDVAASIFQAVVDQTVAGLTQGRELKGKIVFLGGPLHFLMGLRQRFVETLALDGEHAIFPEDGDCFAAMGAALCATDYQPVPSCHRSAHRRSRPVVRHGVSVPLGHCGHCHGLYAFLSVPADDDHCPRAGHFACGADAVEDADDRAARIGRGLHGGPAGRLADRNDASSCRRVGRLRCLSVVVSAVCAAGRNPLYGVVRTGAREIAAEPDVRASRLPVFGRRSGAPASGF